MKIYQSTRSAEIRASAAKAIYQGLAPDGGLFIPSDLSSIRLSPEETLDLSPLELAARTLSLLLDGFSPEELTALVEAGYAGKFETEDLTPLAEAGDVPVLELFRGPTCAFKDVALSLLPGLIVAARDKLGRSEEIAVLTATSGDTGKAALEGFRDVPGTRILVFYPQNGVSDVQQAQMTTQRGANVHVAAVQGNFDDAQTGVKAIFAHDQAHRWAAARGVQLSSANSINLGRLAPQLFYYYKAYADLVRAGRVRLGQPVNFAVPTGNFGNILAGELARRAGLPIARLICASNANDVLTGFIRTGRYDRQRPFHRTASPSMDILVSSNLERYLFLATEGDAPAVADMMARLREEGVYTAPESVRARLRETFWAASAADPETLQTIGRVWRERGYLLDPHTAVAWNALEQFRREADNGCLTVVLATASPFKFPADVLRALGLPQAGSGFRALEALSSATGLPVPPPLAELERLPVLHRDAVAPEGMLDYVKEALAP